jgi:sodium pump decarboxylase gamma subunit
MRILPIEVTTGAVAANSVPDWMVVVMGLATVFVALIALIVICKVMGALVGNKAEAPAAKPAAAAPAAPAAPEVLPQQTVAAIAAAIAENMGTDVSKIRILSIKKI